MATAKETTRNLKERCTGLREQMTVSRSASEDDLAAYWPGGASNPGAPGLSTWIHCYANYLRLMDRAVMAKQRELEAAEGPEREQQLMNALRGAPQEVKLISPIAPDADTVGHRSLFVYPKSYDALVTLAQMERSVRELVLWRRALEHRVDGDIEVLTTLDVIARGLAMLQASFVWIVTHPGPGLPYAMAFAMPWDLPTLVPAWCRAIDPVDLVRLTNAHIDVNMTRLTYLPRLEETDKRKHGWATFFTSFAEVTHVPAADLPAAYSLTALLAQSALAAAAMQRREAERKAKGKGKKR